MICTTEMGLPLKSALVFGVLIAAISAGRDVFFNPVGEDECPSRNVGGVEYILRVRGRDYGWKEHTHRANIALKVDGYRSTDPDEMTLMELQLEEEVVKSLLKNQTSHENDLAMFIHALIATQKNPWNFHGLNLVDKLLKKVINDQNVHPFLVLALCNSHAVQKIHLENIKKHLITKSDEMNPEDVANKALSLKAFACASNLSYSVSLEIKSFKTAMQKAQKSLADIQESTGKFGNVYTTSLVVQALTAYNEIIIKHMNAGWSEIRWNENKALDYLRGQSKINVNLLQAYYIVLALNARKVRCIKDLYSGNMGLPVPSKPSFFTTYSIMDEQNPDVYFTVIMNIPEGSNFFEVMETARDMSGNFNFSYFNDKSNLPFVYEVIGKPNDAEQNLFWTICLMSNVNHDPHTAQVETHASSPKNIIIKEREHWTLWFRSSNCPRRS